jgi:hypothetical protein
MKLSLDLIFLGFFLAVALGVSYIVWEEAVNTPHTMNKTIMKAESETP